MMGDLSLLTQFISAHANLPLSRESEPQDQVSIMLAPCFTVLDIACIENGDTVVLVRRGISSLGDLGQKMFVDHMIKGSETAIRQ